MFEAVMRWFQCCFYLFTVNFGVVFMNINVEKSEAGYTGWRAAR